MMQGQIISDLKRWKNAITQGMVAAMLNKDPEYHPGDIRNLILFMVLSVALWVAFDHFVLSPQSEALRASQQAKEEATIEAVQTGNLPERPRSDVVREAKRITFENPHASGSINLTGGRIDDLLLKDYFRTVGREENVVVLSPAGTPYPRYGEFGWVAQDQNIKVPDSKSQWSVVGNDELSPESPVTLRWSNGQGLVFEKTISLDEYYGFTIDQNVQNNSGRSVTLYPFALVTEHGLPEEYFNRWIIHEGPIGYLGEELYERKYKNLEERPREQISAEQGWIGITEKYWLTALVPGQRETTNFRFAYTPPPTPIAKERYQTDMLGAQRVILPGEQAGATTHFFAGAKKVKLLEEYEQKWNVPHFDLAVDFGIFYFLTRPFFWCLNLFYGWVGNFGIAIIMFTVVLRIAVFPLANTSYRSFAKLRQVSPQMYELREKYKDDKAKLQQELVKLYQEEKVNPMAGCLPILVQIPIFFALFKVLSNTIEMRHAPFFGHIQDLSVPDPTSLFNLFGLIPWDPPSFLMIGIWPCLMLITMIFQRAMSPPPQDKTQAMIINVMPYLMCFILAGFASGLVIYWTFSNLLAVIQQYVIMRSMNVPVHFFGIGREEAEEKLEEAVKEGPAVHPQAKMIEDEVEDALFSKPGDNDAPPTEEGAPKKVSKPKPKKKKKK